MRFKELIKKYGPLYSACRYARHPSVAKRDFDIWSYRRKLLADEPRRVSGVLPEDGGVVVSLTSYGKRLDIVHLTILSLMHQTVMPDLIVLWLDCEDDSALVPDELTRLEKYGLDIRYGCENLKGHKKYFWALREFAGACVITVDDDVMYPPDTVESLIRAHERFPEAIVGRRVHRMTLDGGSLAHYVDWQFEWHENDLPRKDLLATGVGGILYPPRCFGDQAFDLGPIADTGLGNDDLWLKANEIIDGRDVAWAPCSLMHPHPIAEDPEEGLYSDNRDCGNDTSIIAIERAMGVSFAECAR